MQHVCHCVLASLPLCVRVLAEEYMGPVTQLHPRCAGCKTWFDLSALPFIVRPNLASWPWLEVARQDMLLVTHAECACVLSFCKVPSVWLHHARDCWSQPV